MKKTKTMILNHQYLTKAEYPSTIANLNGKNIENVRVFRYLGCEIKFNDPGTGDTEIELRIDCAECKFYQHSKKFMNNKIDIKTRVLIFNSFVRSRLTYSCQIWVLSKRQLNRINSTYMLMLRKMVKGGFKRKNDSWSFKLTNKDMLANCKTESIEEYFSRLQRNYLAHLIRKSNNSIIKRLLFNTNEAKKRGPQINLEKTVLKKQGCTADEFYRDSMTRKS